MKLRLFTIAVYTGLAMGGFGALARPIGPAWRAITQHLSHEPDVAWPWLWLLLTAALLLVLADLIRLVLAKRQAGMLRYALLLGVVASCLSARKLVKPPQRPSVNEELEHLLARTELAADAAFARDKRYPLDTARLELHWPAALRSQGHRSRGALPLYSRAHIVRDATQPALRAGPEVHPGDIVFAVDDDLHRYWITAFRLDPLGRLRPLSARSRVIVATGVDGHPSSRLDPFFPEYPRKRPPRNPGLPGP